MSHPDDGVDSVDGNGGDDGDDGNDGDDGDGAVPDSGSDDIDRERCDGVMVIKEGDDLKLIIRHT